MWSDLIHWTFCLSLAEFCLPSLPGFSPMHCKRSSIFSIFFSGSRKMTTFLPLSAWRPFFKVAGSFKLSAWQLHYTTWIAPYGCLLRKTWPQSWWLSCRLSLLSIIFSWRLITHFWFPSSWLLVELRSAFNCFNLSVWNHIKWNNSVNKCTDVSLIVRLQDCDVTSTGAVHPTCSKDKHFRVDPPIPCHLH